MPTSVCVLGAGVVGLSTALRIKEIYRTSVDVTIIAKNFGDKTTSYVAAGSTYFPGILHVDYNGSRDSIARDIELLSYERYFTLFNSPEAATVGVHQLKSYAIDYPGVVLPAQTQASGHKITFEDPQPLSEEELYSLFPNLPPGCTGISLKTLLISPRTYLPWLMNRFTKMGGKVKKGTVESFEKLWPDYDVVMNCTGLGSHSLAGDTTIIPSRGQVIRLNTSCSDKLFIYINNGTPNSTYLIWTPDGVVLGGSKDIGNSDLFWRKDQHDLFVANAKLFFPWVEVAENTIISEEVGLRPHRPALRIETEEHNYKGTKKWVIHNYGHSASGIYLSWGTSCVAVDMLSSIINRSKL